MFAQNAGGVRRGVRSSAALPAPNSWGRVHAAFQEDSFQWCGQVILFKEPVLNGGCSVPVTSPCSAWMVRMVPAIAANSALSGEQKLLGVSCKTGFVGFSYNLDAEDRIPT